MKVLMVAKKSGKSSDPALNWFCHFLVTKRIDDGVRQWEIARLSRVPKSAINRLLRHGEGIGMVTGRMLARYFGYPDYSKFVAEMDAWWATDGQEYRAETLKRWLRERLAEQRQPEPPEDDQAEPTPRKKRQIA